MRETLKSSSVYAAFTEEQIMQEPFGNILATMRYLDHKFKMEKAEHDREMRNFKSKNKVNDD